MIADDAGARSAMAPAFALALAAAISLGLARFSYALLLPPMRADLGWSYFTAGAMNTANAAGYLVGALLAPRWLARHDARRLLLAGAVGAAATLAAHAAARGDLALYGLRLLTGIASAMTFVAGGVLAARLAQTARRPGLVLGLYYGGTGVGIVVSTLAVPALAWRSAWLALALAALLFCGVIAAATRGLDGASAPAAGAARWRQRALAPALASYFLFGMGYIGYMTFVVTLLRERHVAPPLIVGFYGLLGVGVVASSWLWAGMLQRQRGGASMAVLNALLAVATLLPVLSSAPAAVIASGALFGSVFLSVVASTTALVRHNLPPAAWPGGIAAFTIVFAAGQIVGPGFVGWLADGPGGLSRGFVWSAGFLALGALLATRQRALSV